MDDGHSIVGAPSCVCPQGAKTTANMLTVPASTLKAATRCAPYDYPTMSTREFGRTNIIDRDFTNRDRYRYLHASEEPLTAAVNNLVDGLSACLVT